MFSKQLFAGLLLAAFLSACASKPVPDPEPVDSTYGADGGDVITEGTDANDPYPGGPDAGMNEGPDSVIYFEFDSAQVRAQDRDTVSRHAMQMSNDNRLRVRLEGHADERGSREYNIGLGERRAQAVRQMLMLQGVSAAQITTVSFGEEQPEAIGSSESDYARNRRVVFVYGN